MKPERWMQVKSVVQSALEVDTGDRPAFVFETCGSDDDLRSEVESLLAFGAQEKGFIEFSAVDAASLAMVEADSAAALGRRIGPYKIIREIGRGGMGIVFLANRDDENFEKQVAVKVIKRGMDTDVILDRFRRERQILANLDHAGIARLLDGGTTKDGRPYLVMEYVDGEPINAYCDRNKLSLRDRLELFCKVCAAVDFAHRNLVIHRDLKPGNILVTRDGEPHLLDFGIAKLLRPDDRSTTRLTATELRLMTPEYASPEQVRGDAITTVSDVYSLGVLLYELMSGHSPYRLDGRLSYELARVVTEQEPQKPSQSTMETKSRTAGSTDGRNGGPNSGTGQSVNPKLLRGDLDNIALMAMRKDPLRRYPSASQLAQDIRRHLDGLPVVARPDTFAYRASKFIRRNKVATSAAAVILLTLVVGVLATGWEAHAARVQQQRAEAEREKAQRRFDDIRAMTNSFMFEFYDAIANLPGSTAASELVLKRASEYLDQLAQEAKDDPSLQKELAESYVRLGQVEGSHLMASLGDSARARQSFEKALAICDALVKLDPNNPDYLSEWSKVHWYLAGSMETAGDLPGAAESIRARLPILERLVQSDPDNVDYRYMQAVSYNSIQHYLMEMGELEDAAVAQRSALEIRQKLYDADPTSARWRRSLAIGYDYEAAVQELANDLPDALENQRKALRIREELSAADPENTDLVLMVVSSQNSLGELELKSGNDIAAINHYRQALNQATSLQQADPKSMEYKIDVAANWIGIGDVLLKTGHVREGLEDYQKTLPLREEIAKDDPTGIPPRAGLAESYVKIGDALERQGKLTESVQSIGKGIDIYQTLVTASPADTELWHSLADAYFIRGENNKKAALSLTGPNRNDALSSARDSYQRSADILRDLVERKISYPTDAARLEEIATAISRCRAVLGG